MTPLLAAGLIFLGWHFATTFFVPADSGRARGSLIWPFGRDTRPRIELSALAPRVPPGQPGPTVALVLALISSVGFLGALAALFGVLPQDWWAPLVTAGATGSVGLFVIYLNWAAVVPLVVDATLLWGVVVAGWNAASLVPA